jgi:hypothetical protein
MCNNVIFRTQRRRFVVLIAIYRISILIAFMFLHKTKGYQSRSKYEISLVLHLLHHRQYE